MKNKKSPLQLLVAICEVGKAKLVEQLLAENDEGMHFVLLGWGTSDSPAASLFGFGVLEREVVLAVVKNNNAPSLVQDIVDLLQLENGLNHGVVFTTDLSAAEQEFLTFCQKEGE